MTATVPFAEPPWLNGLPSPIFKETHRRWQAAIRAFIEKHLLAHAQEWERAETVPVRGSTVRVCPGMLGQPETGRGRDPGLPPLPPFR